MYRMIKANFKIGLNKQMDVYVFDNLGEAERYRRDMWPPEVFEGTGLDYPWIIELMRPCYRYYIVAFADTFHLLRRNEFELWDQRWEVGKVS